MKKTNTSLAKSDITQKNFLLLLKRAREYEKQNCTAYSALPPSYKDQRILERMKDEAEHRNQPQESAAIDIALMACDGIAALAKGGSKLTNHHIEALISPVFRDYVMREDSPLPLLRAFFCDSTHIQTGEPVFTPDAVEKAQASGHTVEDVDGTLYAMNQQHIAYISLFDYSLKKHYRDQAPIVVTAEQMHAMARQVEREAGFAARTTRLNAGDNTDPELPSSGRILP